LEGPSEAETGAAKGLKPCDVAIEQLDAAGARRNEPRDDVEQCRLAGADGSDDDQTLAGGGVQAHVAERLEAAEVVREGFDGEGVDHPSFFRKKIRVVSAPAGHPGSSPICSYPR